VNEVHEVVIVRTGTANTASVLSKFECMGTRARLSDEARDVHDAEYLVLPGVGSFGAAMEQLTRAGLVEPLRTRIAAGKPTLCICLGMQLLFEESDESPGVRGLGIVPGHLTRFPGTVRVPQFGWNRVHAPGELAFIQSGDAYYANSYRATVAPAGWRISMSDYAGPFVAAMERGNVLACQFHPELSGGWGIDVLLRWLAGEYLLDMLGRAAPVAPRTAGVLPVRVVPCLDVRDGRVVKGVKFADLRDAGDPAEQAERYDWEGADELVLLDVSATTAERAHQVETVRSARRVLHVPLTVGGGVRSFDDAARLLDAGADKVAVNSAAVDRPELIREIASRLGNQCAVLALDAARTPAGSWEVVTHAGTRRTGMDAVEWSRRASQLGAGEILLTSFDRDGTGEGYDLELLSTIACAVTVPIIASGGASGPTHMAEAVRAGASAVLAASIFHDSVLTVGSVKDGLERAGVPVRREIQRTAAGEEKSE